MERKVWFSIVSPILYFTGGQELKVEPGLKIFEGVTVISGRNGSGKSSFAKILEKGKNFRTNKIMSDLAIYPKIRYLEFQDIHSLTGFSVEYYQQRYEATMNDEVPTVEEILGEKVNSESFKSLTENFNIKGIKNKKINYLSSGELRKLLIINALLDSPDILFLDNPYIGLDYNSKITLNRALSELKKNGKSIMLIMADKSEAPDFTDDFIYADNSYISKTVLSSTDYVSKKFDFKTSQEDFNPDEIVCQLNDCTINYGNIGLINNFNWVIKRGERWSLSGPNGSGKSTILSLINADNPKSYCNDIILFGRKRGSGESIWDIKSRIGYVSPEMQLHFHGSGSALQLVANGLNDTVGLYVKPPGRQLERAFLWLDHFNISHLSDKLFSSLSSGEKQLVLIARAMIKEPDLLILDEPMHGLDKENIKNVKLTIEDFLRSRPDAAFIMVTHEPCNLPSIINNFKTLYPNFS